MDTMEDLDRFTPETKLLYVTPEQCQTSSFRNVVFSLNQRKKLSLIAVDEVGFGYYYYFCSFSSFYYFIILFFLFFLFFLLLLVKCFIILCS